MCILANNFICKFFSDTFTPSERTFLTNDIVAKENSMSDQSLDLQILSKNRIKYPTNPLNGYRDINSLRNKIIDVREVVEKLSLNYFVISETKLHESFPSVQFNISNYEIRNWRDRDKNGSGLIEFVRKGFMAKRLRDHETQICETICSQFTVSIKICL